jgi:predicted nucleic acid-binding protein
MPFVVDSSVAGGWVLPDERSETATALGRQLEEAAGSVPDLFWHEMRNLLVLACRRGRLDPDFVLQALGKIERLPLRTAAPGDTVAVVQLALKHRLTAYTKSH